MGESLRYKILGVGGMFIDQGIGIRPLLYESTQDNVFLNSYREKVFILDTFDVLKFPNQKSVDQLDYFAGYISIKNLVDADQYIKDIEDLIIHFMDTAVILWIDTLPKLRHTLMDWGYRFIQIGQTILNSVDFDLKNLERVVDCVFRSRFCFSLGHTARLDSAILLASAYASCGLLEDKWLWGDLALEFKQDQLDWIKAQSKEYLLCPQDPT